MTSFPDDPTRWDVAAERERLAGQLAELRRRPGAPLGDDADVLRMSLPPYVTATPNPDLAEWLEATGPASDTTERPDPGPFSADISEGKSSLAYKAHSYPTKVPYQAIMRFLLHYTEPGDVVLDGFCGSGMTGVAAQACAQPDLDTRRRIEHEMGNVRWGPRRAVLSDLSPSATFLAAGLNLPIDAAAFDRRSAEILDAFDAEWGWMYRTSDERGIERTIDYTVWSEVFTCPSCGGPVVYYDVAYDQATGRVAESFNCPSCGVELTKDRAERRTVPVRTMAGDTTERIDLRPVALHYRVAKQQLIKRPDDEDLAVLRRVAALSLPGPVPTHELPFMHMTHERSPLPKKGFTHLHHFWSDRALVSLAALWSACDAEPDPLLRHALLFWVEQALWGLSWQNRHKTIQFGKMGGSAVNNYMSGVYYVPSLTAECRPRYNLEGSMASRGKRRSLVKYWEQSPAKLGRVAISAASSTNLGLPDGSIDYIFIDPPFGSNIYYADLAYIVDSWHGVFADPSQEAIVNQSRRVPRSIAEYGQLMELCFREFHRVLKPGRWMTVEFSNSSNEVWRTIQQALAHAGFVVADTRVFDKENLSYRQVTATNAVKRDLIISAYKPADELAERLAPVLGTPETAWEFVREHLSHLPIVERASDGTLQAVRERLPDRLYDRMEAFHIQRGMVPPVTAAEFFAGLEERFPALRDRMVFLEEQADAYDRERLQAPQIQQAELFITNETSAVQWLRDHLATRGTPQPFSAIQPDFFKEVTSAPDWAEIPDLLALLDGSFLQDDHGRWYVPDPRRAADLEKLRRRALLKEFAAYQGARSALRSFRSDVVHAGFSDAWEKRNFAAIVAVGRRLPPDAFTEDERLLFYLDNAEQLTA